MRLLAALLLAIPALSGFFGSGRAEGPAQDPHPGYETRTPHDPNGIGKFYLGREIAHVMGHQAAAWLERPEREEEEAPSAVIEALDLKAGMVVADVGVGTGYFAFRMAPKVGETGRVLG